MQVTFLGSGTSQGVPVIGCQCRVCRSLDYRNKRLRSSVHILVDGKSFVIDTGPDFRQQMLREDIRHLSAVIFTHGHKDHTAGLDDVRAYNFLQQTDMPVYGSIDVLEQLKKEFAYVFASVKYPGIPQLRLHELNGENFMVEDVEFIPLPVMHLHMPVLGFRVGAFSYITDAKHIPDETLKKIKGSRVVVLNSLQKEPHISHFNLDEAVNMAQVIGAEKTYFTHISHKLGLHDEIEKKLPDGIQLAYDGLKLTI